MLKVFKRIWKKYPDLRFGQVVVGVTQLGEELPQELDHIFFIEDDEMMEKLLKFEEEIEDGI